MSAFASHGNAIAELIGLLVRHRALAWEMARREVLDRYAGEVLGALWAITHPLLLMGTYLFVFTFVFGVKTGTASGEMGMAVYMLAGLIPWMCIQDVMTRSSTVVAANAGLVKSVIFPLEILPIKLVLAALATEGLLFGTLLAWLAATGAGPDLHWLLLIPLLAVQALGTAGLALVLAAIGVFVRDVKDVVGLIGAVAPFLMPIFYRAEMLPEWARPLLWANPFTYPILCFQDVLYFREIAHAEAWVVTAAGSLILFYGGYRVFRKLKAMFGNVL
jgi:lipopolysaccharide transport system permease protein